MMNAPPILLDATCTVGANVHESMATKVGEVGPELTPRMRRSIRPTRSPAVGVIESGLDGVTAAGRFVTLKKRQRGPPR